MKQFKESDVDTSGNLPRITEHYGDLIHAPLPWQNAGLHQTASGYGKKLTTAWKISFNGKLYRLYATCFSNVASVWFETKGRRIWVN